MFIKKILIFFSLMVFVLSPVLFSQNITNKLGTNGNFYVTEASGNQMYFIVNNPTGNVGIGSNLFDSENPEKLLIDCGITESVTAIYASGSINSYFQFNIQNLSNGTQASSDIVATSDNGTEETNYVNLGINSSTYVWLPGNHIEFGRPNDCYLLGFGNDLYIANSNSNKDVVFLVGGTKESNERLRIKANGKIGIGVSNPSNLLSLSGGAYSNGTSWTNASDSTLKRDVESLTKYGLADLMKMRSVSYYYKSDPTGKHEIGFIAQELKNIIPEAVSGEEGNMGVSYGNLVPVLVNAIKEQQTQLDKQNDEIESMKNDIKELKSVYKVQTAGMDDGSSNILYVIFFSLAIGAVSAYVIKLRAKK